MSEKTLNRTQSVSFYLLWLISGALSVLDGLALRSAITGLTAVLASGVPMETQIRNQRYLRWTVPAVDQFALALLGLCAMLTICGLDHYYQAGLLKGTIRKRFGAVTAIQVGILLLCGIVIWIASIAA